MLGLTGNNADHAEIRELLKYATALAKEKDFDNAIANLLTAYKLMETCSTEWGIKAFFRVARYHHLAGRYDVAIEWLQQLHDNVDAYADAREILYKEWGWLGKGGYAKVSKTVRNINKKCIKEEIALYKTRQSKIELREEKRAGLFRNGGQ